VWSGGTIRFTRRFCGWDKTQVFQDNLRTIFVKSPSLRSNLNLEYLEDKLQTSLENVGVSMTDRRRGVPVLHVGPDIIKHQANVGVEVPV